MEMETIGKKKKINNREAREAIDSEDTKYNMLKELVMEIISKNPAFAHQRIREFDKKLKENFPNYIDYRMYFALTGALVEPEWKFKEFDFPGEFSVRKFILDLWDESQKLNEEDGRKN